MSIILGEDRETGELVELPLEAFRTHLHMPGATGKGKSTAILLMLQQLLRDWRRPHCHVLIDFLGGLADDVVTWMSTDRCPQEARDRLVYINPAENARSVTINPLLYDDADEGYFRVNRATELILRAWTAQNLGEQPRLARWLFNCMWACAQLGLTVADTEHLLLPSSKFHDPIMRLLPENLRNEWNDVLSARGGEATKILDSTRNRMKPFQSSGILRRMFSSTHNRLDAKRMMREGKIVIFNLAPMLKLSPGDANAIAGLVVNEFLSAARSQPKGKRFPTYLWLDEFQRMVTPDIEYAIPEMRQLEVRVILAHQSFSQLKTQNVDLTSLIWQPQTRIMFGEQGEDADLLAMELASLTYDPKWLKEEITSLKQIQVGHEKILNHSWTDGITDTSTWGQSNGRGWNESDTESRRGHGIETTRNTAAGKSRKEDHSTGGGQALTHTKTTSEQLIAKLENIREVSSRQYYSFEEQKQMWARKVRE